MFGNLGQLASIMKDFQDVKQKIAAVKTEMAHMEFSAADPNHLVEVVLLGDLTVKSIQIASDAQASTLAEPLSFALNQALAEIKAALASKLSEAAGGLPVPSLL